MRFMIFALAAVVAAPVSAMTSFETREDCLQSLQRALFTSELAARVPEMYERNLAGAPPAAREHAEAALDAVKRRAQADIDYADAVLLICQSYD